MQISQLRRLCFWITLHTSGFRHKLNSELSAQTNSWTLFVSKRTVKVDNFQWSVKKQAIWVEVQSFYYSNSTIRAKVTLNKSAMHCRMPTTLITSEETLTKIICSSFESESKICFRFIKFLCVQLSQILGVAKTWSKRKCMVLEDSKAL